MEFPVPELSAVEYDHKLECYVALLSNGEFIMLEASNIREAELEANRFLQHNEFSSFVAPGKWE